MDPRAYVPHFHDLKVLGTKSPAHYHALITQPAEVRELESDRPAFRFGRLCHKTILGGDYVVFSDGDRRGKKWETFAEANKGRDIFKADEVNEALAIAAAVRTHPIAGELLEGEHEVPVEWTMLGRKVATRGLDILNRKARRHVELKTTSNGEPYTFQRGASRFGYHAQCAMYDDAARSLGVDIKDHFVITVETFAPYVVTVHHIAPRVLEEGRKLVRSWMERLQACEEANEWPAYTQSIVEWDLDAEVGLIIDGEEVAA